MSLRAYKLPPSPEGSTCPKVGGAENSGELGPWAERLMLAMSAGDQGLWDLDLETGELILSALWWHQLGESPRPPSTLDDWMQRVHPDDREQLEGTLLWAKGNDKPIDCEYRARHQDGSWRFMRCRAHVVPRASG